MDFVRPVEAVIPGAQGMVLAVLAETTAELNLRTVARLAGISPTQASRILPRLVELGIVERREVPPSSLFVLNRENVAARVVLELARSWDVALDRIAAATDRMSIQPASVIIFGSFARRQADQQSDIDALIVRPDSVDGDDDDWSDGVEAWRNEVRALTGNVVEVIEVSRAEAAEKLAGGSPLWREIERDGVTVSGAAIELLGSTARG